MSDAIREAVARALCLKAGSDPDKLVAGKPHWQGVFLDNADAAIAAYKGIAVVKVESTKEDSKMYGTIREAEVAFCRTMQWRDETFNGYGANANGYRKAIAAAIAAYEAARKAMPLQPGQSALEYAMALAEIIAMLREPPVALQDAIALVGGNGIDALSTAADWLAANSDKVR